MDPVSFEIIEQHVIKTVEEKLSSTLYYHGKHHTLEVLHNASRIAADEGITAPKDIYLLKVACLYHDIGFIEVYEGHEIKGCEIARTELKRFGLSGSQINIVCGLIMATRIPQSPKTKLEKIICDADLDYLGTDNFDDFSNILFEEKRHLGMVENIQDWNKMQLKFLNSHEYFNLSVRNLRNSKKKHHLEKIKKLVLADQI